MTEEAARKFIGPSGLHSRWKEGTEEEIAAAPADDDDDCGSRCKLHFVKLSQWDA